MKRAAPVVLILLASCAPPMVSGLMPIDPAPDNSRTDSVRPILRWERMPDGDDPRISELVYDVQILDGAGWLLAERAGLTSCEYAVEAPLQYGHAYLWTVRARFRWEGRRRETEWSRLSDPAERLATLAVPPPKYLPFRTPEKKESPDTSRKGED